MSAEIWHGGTREVWGSGIVPWTSDTKRQLWIKKLLVIQQNATTPDADNYPSTSDTIRVLKLKCVRAAS